MSESTRKIGLGDYAFILFGLFVLGPLMTFWLVPDKEATDLGCKTRYSIWRDNKSGSLCTEEYKEVQNCVIFRSDPLEYVSNKGNQNFTKICGNYMIHEQY